MKQNKLLIFAVSAASLLVGVTFGFYARTDRAECPDVLSAEAPAAASAALVRLHTPAVYDENHAPVPHRAADYPVNEHGQTYGVLKDVTYAEDSPELIAVMGEHGIAGYIYLSDYWEEDPASPEEALRREAEIETAKQNGTYQPGKVTVYASDGRTPLDTLTFG